jgi:cytochrome c peroxidase
MKKLRIVCTALLGLCGALGGVTLLLYDCARADVLGGPLPPPLPSRDTIQLTPVEKLGKLILYDSTLSNPPGYACATCHVTETGYTGPNSEINAFSGSQPGVVPGGAAIASLRAISTRRSVLRVPTTTPACDGGYSPLLVKKLANRPYTPLFKQVYGQDAFQLYTLKQVYELFGEALAAYQSSGEVCAFSSKYDASKYGCFDDHIEPQPHEQQLHLQK